MGGGLPPWLPIKPHKHPTGRESTGALHWAALPREGTVLGATAKQRVDVCSWHLVAEARNC